MKNIETKQVQKTFIGWGLALSVLPFIPGCESKGALQTNLPSQEPNTPTATLSPSEAAQSSTSTTQVEALGDSAQVISVGDGDTIRV